MYVYMRKKAVLKICIDVRIKNKYMCIYARKIGGKLERENDNFSTGISGFQNDF